MEHISLDKAVAALEQWLQKFGISTLNVAGPRASGEPRIYNTVKEILTNTNWNDHDTNR